MRSKDARLILILRLLDLSQAYIDLSKCFPDCFPFKTLKKYLNGRAAVYAIRADNLSKEGL